MIQTLVIFLFFLNWADLNHRSLNAPNIKKHQFQNIHVLQKHTMPALFLVIGSRNYFDFYDNKLKKQPLKCDHYYQMQSSFSQQYFPHMWVQMLLPVYRWPVHYLSMEQHLTLTHSDHPSIHPSIHKYWIKSHFAEPAGLYWFFILKAMTSSTHSWNYLLFTVNM